MFDITIKDDFEAPKHDHFASKHISDSLANITATIYRTRLSNEKFLYKKPRRQILSESLVKAISKVSVKKNYERDFFGTRFFCSW